MMLCHDVVENYFGNKSKAFDHMKLKKSKVART
jgi:hypothetical protein